MSIAITIVVLSRFVSLEKNTQKLFRIFHQKFLKQFISKHVKLLLLHFLKKTTTNKKLNEVVLKL